VTAFSTPVLRTERLGKRFGALQAVSDVSLVLPQGARHALIGPNGAGKTTFINLLTGVLAPSTGEVYLGEDRITALRQHPRVKRGLTRTFQINTLFPGLTVLESVVLAILQREGLAARWWLPVARYREQIDEAMGLLATLRLADDAGQRTAQLPYGRQRLVEIALALATRPRILLLDEPAAGIPAAESAEVFGVIAALPASVTILFIEHDMGLVFRFAERITVLAQGAILAEGTPAEVGRDERVRAVYLGREDG
jgi:branched-chain amino acid transport system ATP-binding protein